MSNGYIYCFSNPSMPGKLKIGMTTRTPAERADELYSTGVPTPFIVEFYAQVNNVRSVENTIHIALEKYRIPAREFFNINVDEAKKIIIDSINNNSIITDDISVINIRKHPQITNMYEQLKNEVEEIENKVNKLELIPINKHKYEEQIVLINQSLRYIKEGLERSKIDINYVNDNKFVKQMLLQIQNKIYTIKNNNIKFTDNINDKKRDG
jgi:hypothetical protein